MRAAIYARISRDREGAGLGVERQIEDCKALAEKNGWDVVITLVDNDLSAYSGKPRPGYKQLLQAMESHQIDVVIAWHADRLHRRNAELEKYIDISERSGIATHTVKAGQIDLATPAGRAIARTLGAWASYEVETATARIKAAKLQQARSGKFSGGQRPWGYEAGCKGIREDEAAIYRELVDRVIAGESFSQCEQELKRRGIKTQHGKDWIALKIRNLLLHARYAGLREHNGAVYPAEWPAIVTVERYNELQLAIREHKRQKGRPGPGRKYLGTGFIYCGNCGHRMNTCPKSGGNYTRYVCLKRTGGCGRMYRRIEPVDLLIKESIIYRLDTDSLGDLLNAEDGKDVEVKELHRQREELTARLKLRRDEYDEGLWSRVEYQELKQKNESALHDVERQLEAATRARRGIHMLPAGQSVRTAWEANDLAWRRQLVSLLIERVVVLPSNTTGLKKTDYFMDKYQFRQEDIRIEWKA